MTIDERLDRLVERHEALAQTVEHLTLNIEATNRSVNKMAQSIDKMAGMMNEIIHGTALLLSRSNTHDALLDEHGKRITKLEE